MFRLAFHNLVQHKPRFFATIGGVALALSLILALDAVFTGVATQVTSYIDNSGADVFVSQSGVRTMHMASTWLPAAVVGAVKAVPDVRSATPILYTTDSVAVGVKQAVVYVIGIPPQAESGIPWRIAEGKATPAAGETVLDRGLAANLGLHLGDSLTIISQSFRVVGLSEGTGGIVSAIAFIPAADFSRMRGNDLISYVLVTIQPGADASVVAQRIEAHVTNVTAQTRATFATQERTLINAMGADIISIMNLIGFVIGLSVVALTTYIATLARRTEYGMLKALGARNAHLYRVVLSQSLLSVAIGLAAGVAFTLLVAVVVPVFSPSLALQLSGASVLKVGILSLLIAGLAALLPIVQITRLDPAQVFRGRNAQ